MPVKINATFSAERSRKIKEKTRNAFCFRSNLEGVSGLDAIPDARLETEKNLNANRRPQVCLSHIEKIFSAFRQ